MALSEYEQKMLEQLEAQLRDEDPKLAESFQPVRQVSLKRIVVGIFIVVAGLGLLVAAVATEMSWIGIIGFVVMLGGAMYMLSGPIGSLGSGAGRPRQPQGSAKESFMSKQEELWERRRDKDGR
ncbi:DUF3040 domain-containing protein [Flaviflexus equikiangi]|uniref:DUF3040 domain-containing protein n=1 Tax=Flaviflexus equikiangi TaxID=2758573 RepID=A0ABS2TER3_9ACTO|nr:DUF3040 domain-containing protein [Flaviflexus equikiangi]MBM9433146.1 DUF3040 domain-containing protein [Flaviflexus equikiangi]